MDMVNLSYARMLLKVASPLHVTFNANIKINETVHLVRVVGVCLGSDGVGDGRVKRGYGG